MANGVRLVRHRGRLPNGRPCRHLLIKESAGCMELRCECGAVVKFKVFEAKTEDSVRVVLVFGEDVEVEG